MHDPTESSHRLRVRHLRKRGALRDVPASTGAGAVMPKVTDDHLATRRRQIVEAATRTFAEQGFAGTSMADIVRASGLSMGAVYRYFSSKEDLVLAVVAGRDGQQEEGGFPQETATELLRRLSGYVTPPDSVPHARLVSQIWGEAAVRPQLAAVARERHEKLQRHLASLLGGEESPTADGAEDAATVALAALVGYAALVATETPVNTDGFLRVLDRVLIEAAQPAAPPPNDPELG